MLGRYSLCFLLHDIISLLARQKKLYLRKIYFKICILPLMRSKQMHDMCWDGVSKSPALVVEKKWKLHISYRYTLNGVRHTVEKCVGLAQIEHYHTILRVLF